MKKSSVSILLIFLCLGLSAQYKKASFFGKEGRTYGLGAQMYAMGDGKGSPIGFAVTFGRDRDDKQFFSSWELAVIPSYKFSYTTTNSNEETVTANGSSKTQLVYGVNYGYHLLKNTEDRKVKPFVSAGFNIVLFGGVKSVNEDSYDYKKIVPTENFSAGFRGGLGCLYNFSQKFSLKLDGGYNYQFNVNSGYSEEVYNLFTSHVYASAGIRFRLVKE